MLDAYDRASSFDRHAGVNIPNHQDPKVDELLDHLRQAGTEADYIKAGEDLQNMPRDRCCILASPPCPTSRPLETM